MQDQVSAADALRRELLQDVRRKVQAGGGGGHAPLLFRIDRLVRAPIRRLNLTPHIWWQRNTAKSIKYVRHRQILGCSGHHHRSLYPVRLPFLVPGGVQPVDSDAQGHWLRSDRGLHCQRRPRDRLGAADHHAPHLGMAWGVQTDRRVRTGLFGGQEHDLHGLTRGKRSEDPRAEHLGFIEHQVAVTGQYSHQIREGQVHVLCRGPCQCALDVGGHWVGIGLWVHHKQSGTAAGIGRIVSDELLGQVVLELLHLQIRDNVVLLRLAVIDLINLCDEPEVDLRDVRNGVGEHLQSNVNPCGAMVHHLHVGVVVHAVSHSHDIVQKGHCHRIRLQTECAVQYRHSVLVLAHTPSGGAMEPLQHRFVVHGLCLGRGPSQSPGASRLGVGDHVLEEGDHDEGPHPPRTR
mmetsp:Transcript_60779/g.100395  ORF Transcript_60779/g.100395 Transcript_60779/m.100395 type:complete len:405 (+) Transcript_60779:1713-2927(+)